MSPASQGAVPQQKVHQYRCPGCAADVAFEPKEGALACPYCGRVEAIPQNAEQVEERSYEAYLCEIPRQMDRLSQQALEVSCQACGSVFAFEPPEVAGACPFCGSAVVSQPRSSDPLTAPEGILPFRVTKEQAAESIRKWLSTRWFAPNALKRLARQGALAGMYVPFWTYDSHTVSYYTGERGEYYYTTETYTDTDSQGRRVTRTRQVRHTRWYPASGRVSRWFDDVLVPATTSISRARLEALEPWDLGSLKPYDPAFLAGHKAQRYQVGLAAGFETAKAAMARVIRRDVEADIGGDEQRVHHIATSYSGVTFKHLLLPVWISAYRFQAKVYQVLVNARTGEVQGERPYSAWKIAGLVLLILAVVLAFLILRDRVG